MSGSRYMTRAVGTARRTLVSTRFTVSTASETDSPGISSILAPTSSSSGPMCWVRMWIRRCTLGSISMAAAIFSWSVTLADSPMSRPFISIASTMAMPIRSRPIDSVPMPSHRGSPVMCETVTAVRAMTRPTRAPRSSSRTTGSSGCLVRRMKPHQLSCGSLTAEDSMTAVRNDHSSSTIATSRMPMATFTDSSSWGWRIFSTPSKTANMPPTLNRISATTNAQK